MTTFFTFFLFFTCTACSNISICRYTLDGLEWAFRKNLLFDQYRLRQCLPSENSALCLDKGETICRGNEGTVLCDVLTYSEITDILHKERSIERTINVVANKSHENFQVVSNFTFLFNKCHLSHCESVTTKSEVRIDMFGALKFVVSNKRSESKDSRLQIENLRTKKIQNVTSGMPILVEDPCVSYKICSLTTWLNCFNNINNMTRVLTSRDCKVMNITYEPVLKNFVYTFDNEKKQFYFSIQKFTRIFPIPYKFFYNITINRDGNYVHQSTNNTEWVYTLPIMLQNNIKKLHIAMYVCIECRCSKTITKIWLPKNEDPSMSLMIGLGIITGILFTGICLLVIYIVYSRQKHKKDNCIKPSNHLTDVEVSDSDDGIITPSPDYTYIDDNKNLNQPKYVQIGNIVKYEEIPDVPNGSQQVSC